MTKKKTLVNESVIRRWGKLANMPALTENYLDNVVEEEEDEMEMDMEAGGDEMEAGGEEPAPEEAEAVEKIVAAVVDAISQETGVDIEVEGEADGGDEMDMDMDMEAGDEEDEDAAMRDPAMRDPAMRDPAMREAMRGKKDAAMRDDKDAAMRDDDKDEDHKGKKAKKESLELEVIDDEELTEAVLKRVVERLLKRQ